MIAAREKRLAELREPEAIAEEAKALALELAKTSPDAEQTRIERYSFLALQSYLSAGRPAPALGVYIWLKQYFPLSDSVSRMARQLANALGRTPVKRTHHDEHLPVPTPFQELKAKVTFEEMGDEGMDRDQIHTESLKNFPLLNHLRAVEVLKLLEAAQFVSLNAGEQLFPEGSPSHSIYLLASGDLELRSTSQVTRQVNEGDFIGDISYFLCAPHSGTAIAKVSAEIISFPRQELQACFERVPRLHQALTDWVYQKIFYACASESLIFRSLRPDQLSLAWDFFIPLHVPAGRVLMEPERICDRFFLILKGRVEVRKEGQPSVRIGPGHFIGERGLILQKQRSAKLVCLSDCHLLECDELTYEELCETFPEIPQSIEERRPEIETYRFSSRNFVVD